jgi:hypothetical protein
MKKCKIENCNNKYDSMGYCKKHYDQIRRYNKIKKRTMFDKNEYRFENDLCYISLYNREQEIIAETIIDLEDYNSIKYYKWYLDNYGYVASTKTNTYIKKKIYLSRLILNISKGMNVDHKSGNKLDNRKENLRIVTRSQNAMNRKLAKDNTSGYKGVFWDKQNKKWRARIGTNNKRINLGSFNDIKNAAIAYNEAALKYHGEFANLNKL